MACNVEIIQPWDLLLLGKHNESDNTSPGRLHVSGHGWYEELPLPFMKAELSFANLYSLGVVPVNIGVSESMFENAQYTLYPYIYFVGFIIIILILKLKTATKDLSFPFSLLSFSLGGKILN